MSDFDCAWKEALDVWFGYELWGTKVGIEFATAKLLDYAGPALEADPNPFALLVLAHLKALETAHDDEARRASLVRLVKGLYARGFSAEQVRQLYRLVDGMMDLPKPLAELAWKEIYEFEKEKDMPLISTAERIGMEKGLAEGLAKGREEGLLEGIEAVLELRFAAPGLSLLPEIRQIEDTELLRQILQSAKTGPSPEAVRQLWANRQ